jgi:methylthioribose-1-phosphate isomerase
MNVLSVEWVPGSPGRIAPGRVRLIDQTLLPGELRYIETDDPEAIFEAIGSLRVRGAPAIGVAAAFGIVLSAQRAPAGPGAEIARAAEAAASHFVTARPTAVNLSWAASRMAATARAHAAEPAATVLERLAREALAIATEDAECCRAIGRNGLALVEGCRNVMTHCNAGSLATAGCGTALAPLYLAREKGRALHVWVDETRPLLQGARLTAWELARGGVECTVICDNTAAQVMREGRVDAVLVGADRIAANGDTANKVGTYGLAVLARAHGIPLYVLAPTSTFDLSIPDGSHIPIEERAAEEVTDGFGRRTAPAGARVYSPAFDVTPAGMIAAIVCERGIARSPYAESLRGLAAR